MVDLKEVGVLGLRPTCQLCRKYDHDVRDCWQMYDEFFVHLSTCQKHKAWEIMYGPLKIKRRVTCLMYLPKPILQLQWWPPQISMRTMRNIPWHVSKNPKFGFLFQVLLIILPHLIFLYIVTFPT